jgi:hypothetical protein
MIKKKFDAIVSRLSEEDKNTMLIFLLESQILEYGIKRALLELPVSSKIDIQGIKSKTLGALINEMERSDDPHITSMVDSVREFNNLRVEIIHHLADTKLSSEELIREIEEKIELSKNVQRRIEEVFTFLYTNVMGLGPQYGEIF